MDSTFQPKGSGGAKVQNLNQPGHGSEMAKVSVLSVRWRQESVGQQKRSGQESLCSVWVLRKAGLAERQESGHCETREINPRKIMFSRHQLLL